MRNRLIEIKLEISAALGTKRPEQALECFIVVHSQRPVLRLVEGIAYLREENGSSRAVSSFQSLVFRKASP